MDAKQLPARPDLEQYKKQAKDIVKSRQIPLADAQFAIAREHGFESWPRFRKHILGLSADDFERAVEALVSGDLATLERLLGKNPELVRARSTRKHHATLLYYVAANGVEDFRQKTPPNIVQIAEALLRAGADVNATARMYSGHDTTLEMTVTSVHPYRAGVLEPLVNLLLAHGAVVQGPIVNACLANGRGRGAELMAEHGAALDMEAAAGLGRLDLVKSLIDSATREQILDAFGWACEFGRTEVADFLLHQGVPIDAKLRHHEQTGLHWAAFHAHVETVKLLLDRGSALDVRDAEFSGTPLEWAQYGRKEKAVIDADDRYVEVIRMLEAAAGH